MEVSYKKDLHHNYLVLPKNDDSNKEAYCVHMLQANSIDGIIKPEPRTIDNHVLYYYDITSKQSFEIIYNKNAMSYKQIRKLLIDLADLLEQTYEYLLNENDLVLEPKHIYIGLSTEQINVCYLPGYNKDIKKQMTAFIEYIMNKVDYKEKEAVLYIYNLYAVCRDDAFSFSDLMPAIKENKTDKYINKDSIKELKLEPYKSEADDNKTCRGAALEEQSPRRHIPVMPEKISEEREKYYYPLITYIYTGASVIGVILVLIISFSTKVVYTSLGNRIDYGKLMALLLILLCIAGYLMKIIWDKKNRLTKMISSHEYIDPRKEDINHKLFPVKQSMQVEQIKAEEKSKVQPDQSNPTVLLNAEALSLGCYLEPEDKEIHEAIHIKDFPYVIGKQKGNVDYWLNKEVVSRYHVKITKEEDKYYITDLNSTNGTCLNEKPLPCYQRYEMAIGDKVAIAGIKYLFQVYE